MEDISNLFYELIRVSIGVQPCLSCSLNERDWESLFEMALKQSLAGICFVGIQKVFGESLQNYECPSTCKSGNIKSIYFQWMSLAVEIQRTNDLLNTECRKISSDLENEGIHCCVVKGQCSASSYGALRSLRQCGDIDLFVSEDEDIVLQYAKRKEKSPIDYSYKHVHLHRDNIIVDVHYRLGLDKNLINNIRFQSWCKRLKKKGFEYDNDLGYYTLSKLDRTVFTIFHIKEHLMAYGVGLRQVTDLYYALIDAKCNNNLGEDLLFVLNKLHLMKITKALMWVLSVVYKAPSNLMILNPDEKTGRFLLKEIMYAGNFGHYDNRILFWGKNWIESIIPKMKFYFRLFRYFPIDVLCLPVGTVYYRLWKYKYSIANEKCSSLR